MEGLRLLWFCAILFWSLPAVASDYSAWQKVLDLHLKDAMFDYAKIHSGRPLLESAVSALQDLNQEDYDRWSRAQKMAFWINAYNIGAVKLVVDHYPLKRSGGIKALRYPVNSIQQVPDVWNRDVLTIAGRKVSLNMIENGILRKEFSDPRIHFAIVCASLGCPVMRSEAYVAEQLDRQLSEQIRIFLSDPAKVRYDRRKDVLYLSPIFKWFKEDFEGFGGGAGFIKANDPGGLFEGLSQKTSLRWLDYDWSLNEQ